MKSEQYLKTNREEKQSKAEQVHTRWNAVQPASLREDRENGGPEDEGENSEK